MTSGPASFAIASKVSHQINTGTAVLAQTLAKKQEECVNRFMKNNVFDLGKQFFQEKYQNSSSHDLWKETGKHSCGKRRKFSEAKYFLSKLQTWPKLASRSSKLFRSFNQVSFRQKLQTSRKKRFAQLKLRSLSKRFIRFLLLTGELWTHRRAVLSVRLTNLSSEAHSTATREWVHSIGALTRILTWIRLTLIDINLTAGTGESNWAWAFIPFGVEGVQKRKEVSIRHSD